MARYLIAMRLRSVLGPVLVASALAGCGGGESGATTEPPCVVPEDEMSDILDQEGVFSAPQSDRVTCIYAAEGQPLVALSIRTQTQFEAERAKFEDQGILLPELVAVDGFEGKANVDPRYNSLNVTAGDRIVSVEDVGGVEAWKSPEELELERAIARAALEHL
jgi:hypothetical protein